MPRAKSRRRRNEQAPGWVWMLCGLSLGLIIAIGAYFYGTASSPLRGYVTTTANQTPPRTEPAVETTSSADLPQETRFDFYDVLPRFEVVLPEVERGTLRANTAIELDDSYVLQAGSFRELADADRMQARIALLGIESQIQRVMLDDDVFHRVRIGPMTEVGRLNRVRRQLRDERIEYLLIHVPQ